MNSYLNPFILCFSIFFNSMYCKEIKIVGLIIGQNDAAFLLNALRSVARCVDKIVYLDNQSQDCSIAVVKSLAKTCNVSKIIKNTQSFLPFELYQQILDEGRRQGGTHFLLFHADELLTASLTVDNYLKNIIHNLESGQSLSLPLVCMSEDYASYYVQKSAQYVGCAFADTQSAFYEHTTESRIPFGITDKQWYLQDQHASGLMMVVNNVLKKEVLQACLTKIISPETTMDIHNKNLNDITRLKHDAETALAPYVWFKGYEHFFQENAATVSSTWYEDIVLDLCKNYGIDYFIDIDMWDTDWHFFEDGIYIDPGMKSQYKQDQFLYTYFFKDKQKGFFVDIGAHDGIKWSNTYFFEKKMEWQGLCIEPLKEAFDTLTKNRSAICINACVGKDNGTADFFNVQGAPEQLSGLVETYHPAHKQRMEREVREDNSTVIIEKVPIYTLNTLLDEHNITHIDFVSLDTEGSEMDILSAIDFDQVYIKVMTIENNFYGNALKEFMKQQGFKLVTRLFGCDDVYVNTKRK